MKSFPILAFLVCSLLPACTNSSEPRIDLPTSANQLVLVTSESWEAPTGTLRRFEREEGGSWHPVGPSLPVALGRSGLAWGRGLHPTETPDGDPVKREGDGKAPAGVFALGTAFGYAALPPDRLKLPYRQATGRDFFVDDPKAPAYNTWVRLEEGERAGGRWASAERMRRDDPLYEFGIVVRHNMSPPLPGAGSAIFLHVWQGPDQPTAGCTAMAREDLLGLMRWIDPEKRPVLIQLPASISLNFEPRHP